MNKNNMVCRSNEDFGKEAMKFREGMGVSFSLASNNLCKEVAIRECTIYALRIPTKPYHKKVRYSENVKFSYYGSTGDCANHKGIIIVCCSVDESIDAITYGVAYCSPEDVYNKETGKGIAYNDMVTNMNTLDLVKKAHHDIN